MIPESFHFLRPAWLLALLPTALVVWAASRSAMRSSAWRRLVDQHLLRHLLLDGDEGARRWPIAALATALAAACVALAGPTWEQIPQPTFTSLEPTVAVVDLSPAMNADDVKPSRLARARFKLHDVLEQTKGGQVALVLYADDAFVAAPLTDDGRVIEEMLPSLVSGLMPGDGSHPERGIAQASALLDQAGVPGGRIVLLTASAGDDRGAALAAAREAAAHGRTLQVIGIGTEEGTALRDRRGRPLADASGAPIVAKLDRAGLEALATSGNGRMAIAAVDDADAKSLLGGSPTASSFVKATDAKAQADVWRDAGVWLVLVPLALAPLAFRRGWLVALAFLALASPARRAEASTWDDLWKTRDQQGQAALEAGQAAAAADLFEAPAWKAAAQYQGGSYADAVKSYQGLDGAENEYNLGNALAKAGQLEPALKAYDAALTERPDDADAKFNRDLVKRLLDEQKKQQQQQKQQSQSQSGQQGDPDKQDQQQGGQGQAQSDRAQGNDTQSQGGGQQQQQQQQADAKSQGAEPQQGSGDAQAKADAQQTDGGDRQASSGDAADQNETQGADAQANAADANREQGEKRSPGEDQKQAQEDAAERAPGSSEKPEERTAANAGAPDRNEDQSGSHQPQQSAAGSARGHDNPEAKADGTLARQMDDALRADTQAPQNAASAEAHAPHRAPTEEEQAREQKLRRVHDDPAGLLRARIQRHFAEQQLSKQEGVQTW